MKTVCLPQYPHEKLERMLFQTAKYLILSWLEAYSNKERCNVQDCVLGSVLRFVSCLANKGDELKSMHMDFVVAVEFCKFNVMCST